MAPAACALVLAATAACGGSSAATSAGTSTVASGTSSSAMGSSASGTSGMAATSTTLMIEKFAFATPDSVSPGAKVDIMNMDGEAHTVTADEGNAFDVKASPGTRLSFTAPTKPGRYAFHCTYHSNMHGVLVVKG